MTATGGAPVLGAGENFRLILGDSREKLAALPENSVDAVVTDPPYGLGAEPDALAMLRDWITSGHHDVQGAGFMGKKWDAFVPQPALWRECLRVLKPGGHLLAFGGSRTYDLVVLGLRIAGFEVRDCIMWLHGQGFPKSLDVSKAIDARSGAEREVTGTAHRPEGRAFAEGSSGFAKGEVLLRDNPATAAAAAWNGWGTALKPAHEPVVVARKPLQGTVAENVLRWGTGAVNVDGCRIDAERDTGWGGGGSALYEGGLSRDGGDARPVSGRWPANVIHDGSDEVLRLFPADAGAAAPVRGTEASVASAGNVTGERARVPGAFHADTGSAARFFYCAKASKADRDEWLDDHQAATAGEITGRADGSAGLDSPRAGAGRTAGGRNIHPTVKPTELMRYLCRLVTPPGGIVLDPFTGSGSTGKAALLEGFRFVGIEREAEYIRIAQARIANATKFKTPDLFTGAAR